MHFSALSLALAVAAVAEARNIYVPKRFGNPGGSILPRHLNGTHAHIAGSTGTAPVPIGTGISSLPTDTVTAAPTKTYGDVYSTITSFSTVTVSGVVTASPVYSVVPIRSGCDEDEDEDEDYSDDEEEEHEEEQETFSTSTVHTTIWVNGAPTVSSIPTVVPISGAGKGPAGSEGCVPVTVTIKEQQTVYVTVDGAMPTGTAVPSVSVPHADAPTAVPTSSVHPVGAAPTGKVGGENVEKQHSEQGEGEDQDEDEESDGEDCAAEDDEEEDSDYEWDSEDEEEDTVPTHTASIGTSLPSMGTALPSVTSGHTFPTPPYGNGTESTAHPSVVGPTGTVSVAPSVEAPAPTEEVVPTTSISQPTFITVIPVPLV